MSKAKPVKLTERQQIALERIAAGWEVVGPTKHFFRALASPWQRIGSGWTRFYWPTPWPTIPALRRNGFVRDVGHFLREGVRITNKGKRHLALCAGGGTRERKA